MKLLKKFNPLKTLFARLFFVFWGTILILIGSTLFISQQLNELDKKEPLSKFDTKRFELLERQFQGPRPNSLRKKIHFAQKKFPHWVVLYQAESQQLIADRVPENLLNKHLRPLFTQNSRAAERKLPNYVVYGPKTLLINDLEYQAVIVRKATPANELLRTLYFSPLWSKIAFAILVTLLPCWLVARNISVPIARLNRSTHALSRGELSHRVDPSVANRADEIGQLANSFNAMAEKIENNLKVHKGLLANVSHELRTPLTRIELSVAMALKDPAKNVSKLHRIESELHKLDALIANVLKLSRLENDSLPLETNNIHLSHLVKEICESASLECEEKNIQLLPTIQDKLYYVGDELLLVCAFENVLRNAIKFTPSGQTIWLELKEQPDTIEFSVLDSGPGVSESELEKIFQPFYRSSDNQYKTRGTGLGLTISNKAVTRHRGHIKAKNIADKGLRVNISLPR